MKAAVGCWPQARPMPGKNRIRYRPKLAGKEDVVAQKTQILYVDDIDGTEAEGTVRFGYSGVDYEIDLNSTHTEEFAKAIAPYLEAARKLPARRAGRGTARPVRHNQSDVREWARAQGLKVSDRGRIPAEVMSQYEAAH
jgi:hypothetical protein